MARVVGNPERVAPSEGWPIVKPTWSRSATIDVVEIQRHIAAANPAAAARIAAAIRASVATLDRFPNRGRIGRIPGTRELMVSRTPYIVAYRIASDRTVVLRIVHAARRWPSLMID